MTIGRQFVLTIVAGLVLMGCAPNKAYYLDCPERGCEPNYIKPYIVEHDGYDLAFVEFTERGNVFDRDQLEGVIDHVKDYAEDGATVVVFVHGWKHNANPSDPNLLDFKAALSQAAAIQKQRERRLIGIYVGWRGLSLSVPLLKELTYWDRKAVAHEIGKGGVTELLVRLENHLDDSDDPNKNQYLMIGHSFGGAILLSSLSETLLERIVTPKTSDSDQQLNKEEVYQAAIENKLSGSCRAAERIAGRPFGHGVVLLNAAVEANEIFQLKELVAQTCFKDEQDRYMHILSSDADRAVTRIFRLAQLLGRRLTWSQEELERTYQGKQVSLTENDLDVYAVGHFEPFITGYLDATDSNENGVVDWDYRSYVDNDDHQDLDENHIPVRGNEPLAFIVTNDVFMKNHNDVFNENVIAYLMTITAEARYKRTLADGFTGSREIVPEGLKRFCKETNNNFTFGPCFKAYLETFREMSGHEVALD